MKLPASGASSGGGWSGSIGVTSVQSSRLVACENSESPSASFPRASWSSSHFAMSTALDMIPPAGLIDVLVSGSTNCTVPSTRAWVEAMLRPGAAAVRLARLSAMPAGPKSRSSTKASHGFPLAASTTSPATMYRTLS